MFRFEDIVTTMKTEMLAAALIVIASIAGCHFIIAFETGKYNDSLRFNSEIKKETPRSALA
jgi:hypothetical protein